MQKNAFTLTGFLFLAASAAFGSIVGPPVSKGTVPNQTLRWNGVTWVIAGLLDDGLNGYTLGTFGIGGPSDGSKLYVAPTGTTQNALTVKMPSGGTGYAWQVLNGSNNRVAYCDVNGVVYAQTTNALVYQVNGLPGYTGSSNGTTFTSGIATAPATVQTRQARFADFSGSTSQTLTAGSPWVRYIQDTQTTATTSASLASAYTLNTGRFLGEAVGKAYILRLGFMATMLGTSNGYLEFALDTSTAGDGSSIKTITPLYMNTNGLGNAAYPFDVSMPIFIRTTTGVTSPGSALIVRYIGNGALTLSAETLTILDASGVSN